jgi:hypothetical protein
MKNKLRFPDKTKVHRFRIVLTKVLFQFRASEKAVELEFPAGTGRQELIQSWKNRTHREY